ncbi:MAG TPA: hypothetical protein VH722_21660 [Alphaproteobacteria bacterium]|jgi:hypothetical protein|nr:hypothetical protein [Alphaproteobacteria bacterium]
MIKEVSVASPDTVMRGVILWGCALSCVAGPARADDAVASGQPSVDDVQKLKQDPISGLKTVYLQNLDLPVGHGVADSFTVQPVWPFRIDDDLKLITYTIIPFQSVPSIAPGIQSGGGMGNVLFNGYFTAAKPDGTFKWGIGPALQLPTRSNPVLGSSALAMGPAGLIYDVFGSLSGGLVVQNLWSVTGPANDAVDLFSTQYFITYNFPDNWYLATNATVTADWRAPSGNRWTVPVGGGFGKTFQISGSDLFYSANVQGFYNAARPNGVGDWEAIVQFQIIFGQ